MNKKGCAGHAKAILLTKDVQEERDDFGKRAKVILSTKDVREARDDFGNARGGDFIDKRVREARDDFEMSYVFKGILKLFKVLSF